MLYNIKNVVKKSNRFFELIPKTVDPAFRFFSSSSTIEMLENEQLKTFKMYKPAKHIVLFIWTYLSSVISGIQWSGAFIIAPFSIGPKFQILRGV